MPFKKSLLGALLIVGLIFSLTTRASAQTAIRYAIPDSDFPISQAVEIPANATLVYLSGQVPSVTDETAEPSTVAAFGFAGFMAGYTQFFGTEEQPNLPSRSAMQIAGLVNPGWLVEIEVVAVRE
ncbi:MAG: hypothetical protein WA947_22230 [Phormidesmis sp.]